MSIELIDNFRINAQKPVRDTDIVGEGWVFANKEGIPFSMRYEFMETTDSEGNNWQLRGGIANLNWVVRSSSQTITSVSIELFVLENDQEIFLLDDLITDYESLQLFVNGVFYAQGDLKDYHVSGRNFYWHGDFSLELSDRIQLKYYQII